MIKFKQNQLSVGLLLPVAMTVLLVSNAPEPARKSDVIPETGLKIGPLEIPAVLVKGGTFDMGSEDPECGDDTRPVHKVTLTDFYISTTEVTIGQYKEYCRKTGKAMPEQEPGTDDLFPVAFVTWYEANEFCEWVGGFLPSEAQWEYAARSGGLNFKYPNGNAIYHSQAN